AEAARFVAAHVPGRYRIVPNGVDVSRFARPVSAGPPHGQGSPGRAAARILYVGRLDARKGLEVLLEAFQALSCEAAPSRRPHLILVGDGPQRPALERRAAALRLPVTFAGAVARERLPAFYRDADLFVAPSTGGESFGITLVEAMAAGLPIVGADLRGYRETAGASGAAVFYPPACPGQLREALASLLADGPRRRSMGAAGLHFARRYDWKVIAGEIEGIYRAALAEPPACAGLAHQAGGLRRAILRSPRSVRASSIS
ncbi:MAG: glycosyltransferase family 4 protein, partial [Candidatus Eisenbacteria bacterium]